MADNYVENHQLEYQAWKQKREQARKHKMHKYLEAYRKRLAEQKALENNEDKNNEGITADM